MALASALKAGTLLNFIAKILVFAFDFKATAACKANRKCSLVNTIVSLIKEYARKS